MIYQDIAKYIFLFGILAFFVLTFKDRYYGAISYTIIYFTRPTELFPILGRMRFELVIAGIILFIIVTDRKAIENLKIYFEHIVAKRLLWFISAIFISIIFSFGILKSLDWFIDFIKLLLFCLMLLATIDSRAKVNKYLWLYAFLVFWIAFVPFNDYLMGNYYYAQDIRRISASTSFFSNPNVLACTLAQSIPLIWVLLLLEEEKKFRKFLKICVLIFFLSIIVATIIFTGSRGGFLALMGVGFFIWARSKKRFLGLVLLILISFLTFAYMGKEYRQRQATILEMGESDQSAKSRIESLLYSLEMLSNRPLFGYGFGCYANARYILGHGWLWPHNIAAQLIGELGLYGIITFSLFIIAVFKTTRNYRKETDFPLDNLRINDALENSFIAQFVIGISQHNLHLYMLYFAGSLILINGKIAREISAEIPNNLNLIK